MITPSVTMPNRMYSRGEFISPPSFLAYRRSQPTVKLMNARNDTRVTTTTIRSSIQFLLVGLWVLGIASLSSSIWSNHGIRRATIPAACGLRSQAQEGLHRKRLGQVGQRVKLCQATWTHPHSRKHDHGEALGVTLEHLRMKPPFPLRRP